jgi:hypothetical protein
MGKCSAKRQYQVRETIAQEAAKWMATHGILDFESAKRRAVKSLGITRIDTNILPSHQQVQQALISYQQLFVDPDREKHVITLREKAYRAMLILKPFDPHLTGMVLDGSATTHTNITLHIFAPTSEEVMIHFINLNIAHDSTEQRVQLLDKQFKIFPTMRFYLAESMIDVIIFPEKTLKYHARCQIHGKTMERANLDTVRALVGLV